MKGLAAPRLSVLSLFSLPSYIVIGPYPAHDVVVIAVRNAVSAATIRLCGVWNYYNLWESL